jgi:surfeit locus 1 family protein
VNELTFWRVARRPQWILALLLVMGLAGGFAWLGKWQLERAIVNGQNSANHVDSVVPLETVAKPGGGTSDQAAGHRVSTRAMLDQATLTTIADRANGDKKGFWLVARELTRDGNLVTVLGWAQTQSEIDAVIARLTAYDVVNAILVLDLLEGRLMPAEAPEVPKSGQDPQLMTTVAPAALINVWPVNGQKTYSGFLIASKAPAGLTAVNSTAPVSDAAYNWLNIFYAIEWIVFAGFAFYVWYRLVRDRLEKDLELDALARGSKE